MTQASQRKATSAWRKRELASGYIRLEIRAKAGDAGLIRSLADSLRTNESDALRARIKEAVGDTEASTAFDIFGSDLPDSCFDGIFERPADTGWRDIEI